MKVGQLGKLGEASDVVVGQVQVGQGHQIWETLQQGVKWKYPWKMVKCWEESLEKGITSFPHRYFFYSILMQVEAFEGLQVIQACDVFMTDLIWSFVFYHVLISSQIPLISEMTLLSSQRHFRPEYSSRFSISLRPCELLCDGVAIFIRC